jgi:hypothetical protein
VRSTCRSGVAERSQIRPGAASGCSVQAEAVKLLKQLNGQQVDGQLLTTSTPTVAGYLEDWFATNSDSWRPSTRRGYRRAIDGFLVPAFGTLRLEQLTPQLVQRWLTQHKAEHGARRRIAPAHATSGGRAAAATGRHQRRDVSQSAEADTQGNRAAGRRPGARVSRGRRKAATWRAVLCGPRVWITFR